MTVLLAAHLCAALAAPWLVSILRRRALWVLALAPASAAAWALSRTGDVLAGRFPTAHLSWVPGLDLDLWWRLDVLSWLMTLVVGGVGALVLVYAGAYFKDPSPGLGRFGAAFVGFAGAMLGVVTVDHSMGLYAFWEATSLLSFLLIGHHSDRRPARAAARQALLVTSSGSLAMFTGLVMLGLAPGGSFRLSELVSALGQGHVDTGSAQVVVGALLVACGALTKSALVPAHFWLPGAMAAPTPVSAYLHAAAMVKAGVYLVARMTPGLTQVPGWSALVVAFGLATMLLGGWRALRQHDLKLVLAYGTVSQLGLITATVGQGSAGAMAAGLTMLVAHSLFKSTLFLAVGAVESATGTRDLRRLSGLGRRRPVLAGAAALAALSMAGVPLTTGYLGKEALLATLLHGSHAAWASGGGQGGSDAVAGLGTGADLAVAGVVAVGSVLTVAYSWRVWWGAFGIRPLPPDGVDCASPSACAVSTGDGAGQRSLRTTPRMMTAPVVVLSLGALAGLAPHQLDRVLTVPGAGLPGTAHLAWWSGWGPAALTAAVLVAGAALARRGASFESFQRRVSPPVSAVGLYAWSLRELEILAARLTRLTQRGSLPWDLSTVLVSLALAGGGALAVSPPSVVELRGWDSPVQAAIGVLVCAAAVLTARSRRRMRAALALGSVGLGVAVMFASQGAPDLALTQIVVEAVSIVVFVLVLRRMPRYFSDRPLARSRWGHLAIAVVVGAGVVVGGLVATSARVHPAVSELMPNEAEAFGNGLNIVNVILVDIRAWDTVGELSVLLVIASGIASLIYVSSRSGRIDRVRHLADQLDAGPGPGPAPGSPSVVTGAVARPVGAVADDGGGGPGSAVQDRSEAVSSGPGARARGPLFLPSAPFLRPERRSTVLEVSTNLLFPTMLVLSVWLLLIGHNNPGGGFAGGVVAGLAFVLRYLAGGRHELGEALPVPAGRILGLGLFIAGAGAMFPLLMGNAVLQSTPVDIHLGLFGDLHFTTAMVLDVGVYVLVVGLVLDLVSAAGAEIDRQHEAEAAPAPATDAGREVVHP